MNFKIVAIHSPNEYAIIPYAHKPKISAATIYDLICSVQAKFLSQHPPLLTSQIRNCLRNPGRNLVTLPKNLRDRLLRAIPREKTKDELDLELASQYKKILDHVQKDRFPKRKFDSRIFESIGRDHFLDSPQNLSLLFSNAQHIVNKFPKGRIVGLGQSPAWILEAAKKLDPAPDRFSNVAFSSSLHNLNLKKDSSRIVSLENIMQYRDYLTKCKLTPSDIIKDPIILVEHTHSGKGLKSFLSILIESSRELGIESQLRSAVHVHIIVGKEVLKYHCPRTSPRNLLIKSGQITSKAFVVAMSNSADDLDRLIPHYAFYKWNTQPNFRELNQAGIDLISRRLNEYFELVSP